MTVELDAILRGALAYIEENLTADIRPEELAERAGLSTFHFLHLFCQRVGSPVRQYTVRRRLIRAADEIARGRKAIDVALAYGFDTHAGFYKAFRRAYGVSPSRYRGLKAAYEPMNTVPEREGFSMQKDELRALLASWPMQGNAALAGVYPTFFDVLSDDQWYVGDDLLLTRTKNLDALQRHLALAEALERAGYAADTAVPTTDGKPYLPRDGYYYCLKKRVNGPRPAGDAHFAGDPVARAKAYGRGIAGLHAALRGLEALCAFDDVSLFQGAARWSLPRTRDVMAACGTPVPEDFFAAYLANFEPLEPTLPRQLIHRDLHADNTLLDGTGAVTGFASFDISAIAPRLYDPCYCATSILSGCIDDPDLRERWFDMLHGILAGYGEVSPLTPEEKRAVPLMIWTMQFLFVAYFSDPDHPYHQVGEANRRMLLFLMENEARLLPA